MVFDDMPTIIDRPTVIPCVGTKPKVIEEYAGRANSGHAQVSVARMVSPEGWAEPGQRPEFEEITVVLKGTLRVEYDGGSLDVHAGQAVVAHPNEWVRSARPRAAAPSTSRSAFPPFRRIRCTGIRSRQAEGQRHRPTRRPMSLAISSSGLRKTFGDLVAVDGIDLAVPRGSFYGFLGPNGAGKSTTIKCLTGLLRPTGGTFRILDMDPIADPVGVKRRIGVMPEDLALFDRLTGAETLSFVGQVHGLGAADVRARSEELLRLMDLETAAGDLVADYSHGMRKKIALAAALLPAPRLLFLDEPFEGIDAIASRQIKDLLTAFVKRGGTIFLTSHILEIVERLCDHIGIIHRGRLVAQGSLADLHAGAEIARTLEETFFNLVGAERAQAPTLGWLS